MDDNKSNGRIIRNQHITKHLLNIYEEEELEKKTTCSKMEQVQKEGIRTVSRMIDFYNLDAIIAVGYRVNSKKATAFRQWAIKTLKEYITKGFVINDELLKNGKSFGNDYFRPSHLEKQNDCILAGNIKMYELSLNLLFKHNRSGK